MALAVPTTSNDYAVITATTGSSITCNKPTNVADGDLLVAWVYYRNSGTTPTAPSGWTQQASHTTPGQSEFVYTKPIPSASSETATSYTWSFTGGSAKMGVIIFRVTGANLTTPLDAAGTWEAGPTGTMVLPAVTAVDTNTMLLEFGLAQTTTTTGPVFTAPGTSSTLTQQQWNDGTSSASMWVGFESVAAAGSTGTRTASLSPNASSGNGIMLTIAPAAAALPTASFTYVVTGTDLAVDGTSSSAVSPATITGYDWNWGDSTTHGSGSTASHTYSVAGSYTVTLTVTDSNSNTANTSQSVTITTPPTATTYASISSSTGWTPTSGTVLGVLTDVDGSGYPVMTTFAASPNNPSSAELDGTLGPLTAPQSGQSLMIVVGVDRINSSSGTLAAQLYEGSTLRSSASAQNVPDMTASGGSGTATSGTVSSTALVVFSFPWTDVQNVVDWNQLILKMQGSAS